MAERDYPGGNPFYDYGPWGATAFANARVYRNDGGLDYARTFERFAAGMKWLGLAGSTLKALYNTYEAAHNTMSSGSELASRPGKKRMPDDDGDQDVPGTPVKKRPRLLKESDAGPSGAAPQVDVPMALQEEYQKPNIKFLDTRLTNSMISTSYTWGNAATSIDCVPANAVNQTFWLNNVTQGVGYNQRTGDQIWLKDIWLKANFWCYSANATVKLPDVQLALIHCSWIDPNVAAVPNPTWYQLWPAGIGDLTAVTPAANYKATVLRKWRMQMSEPASLKHLTANTAAGAGVPVWTYSIDETIPIRREAIYKGTDNTKGALYLIWLSNTNPATYSDYVYGGFATRVYFIDRRLHDTQRSWERKKKMNK